MAIEEQLEAGLHHPAKGGPPRTWRSWLIGRPLATADAAHQTIGKGIGLAVFASDALSSTAYATQEILFILTIAGTAAFVYAFPISIAIVALMAIVTISYEQTIHAYSNGGGAYIVARDNLGELPAQIAGAALLTDYILAVSVSVSSGVAQITSAYPVLFDHRVGTAVHVSINPEETARVQHEWEKWGNGVRLVTLESPYRLLLEPLLDYIDEIDASRQPNEIITVVVPQFVPRHWWHNILHTQTAFWLRMSLLFRPEIVVTDVPYLIK
jgi:amino acid transporter